jgi:hypothetical protein
MVCVWPVCCALFGLFCPLFGARRVVLRLFCPLLNPGQRFIKCLQALLPIGLEASDKAPLIIFFIVFYINGG